MKGGYVNIDVKQQAAEKSTIKVCLDNIPITTGFYILEEDNDALAELDTNLTLKKMLDELSAELDINIKVRISESNLCNPNHWKEDEATDGKPLIVILISCRSYENVVLNNFGPAPPRTAKGKLALEEGNEYEGGIFKNVYYFGFNNYLHLHNAEIYSCKDDHPDEIVPNQTCDFFAGDQRERCCKAKKNHFGSMFANMLKERHCMKFTKESFARKFADLKSRLDRIAASKQKMQTLIKELSVGKFFLLDGDDTTAISCNGDGNPCGIVDKHTDSPTNSKSFNKLTSMKLNIKKELGKEMSKREQIRETHKLAAELDAGLDINKRIESNYENSPPTTLLEKAVWSTNTSMVIMLLSRGAKISKNLIKSILEIKGTTADSPYKEVVYEFFTRNPSMLNQPLQNGSTPLSIALDNKDMDFVRFLLDSGANPALKLLSDRYNGMFPIHIATTLGLTEAIRLLLDRGVDINEKTVSFKKPINIACEIGDAETLRFLVTAGASVTERDRESCRLLQKGGYPNKRQTMRKKRSKKRTRKN